MRGARRTFAAELAPVRALRGIDLDVAAGDFIAITGPSGCGKSTLLNVIAGLDTVDDGTVEVAGERIDGRDQAWLARFRRHHIGIVFQFFNLLDGVSALDNIVLPGMIGGMGRKAAEARARELLDLLGLGDRAQQVPAVLSGGQRQRLAIARALVNSPTLLLADEPTGALDSDGGAEVLELFRRLHDGGQTVIMVTHSPDVAAGADRRIELRDGQLASDSAPTASSERRLGLAATGSAAAMAVARRADPAHRDRRRHGDHRSGRCAPRRERTRAAPDQHAAVDLGRPAATGRLRLGADRSSCPRSPPSLRSWSITRSTSRESAATRSGFPFVGPAYSTTIEKPIIFSGRDFNVNAPGRGHRDAPVRRPLSQGGRRHGRHRPADVARDLRSRSTAPTRPN